MSENKNPVYESYKEGECPDCGEAIPKNVEPGEECANCRHVFWSFRKADDDYS